MLNVLIEDYRFVVRPKIGGERGETKWWKQGVLDRSPVRAGRFGQGREDELYAQASVWHSHGCGTHVAALLQTTLYYKVKSMVRAPEAIPQIRQLDWFPESLP